MGLPRAAVLLLLAAAVSAQEAPAPVAIGDGGAARAIVDGAARAIVDGAYLTTAEAAERFTDPVQRSRPGRVPQSNRGGPGAAGGAPAAAAAAPPGPVPVGAIPVPVGAGAPKWGGVIPAAAAVPPAAPPAVPAAVPPAVPAGVPPAGPVAEHDLDDDEYFAANVPEHLFGDGTHPAGSDPLDHEAAEEDDYFMEEWSEQMGDFIPDMLVTFKLPARGEEFFYQDVGPEPTLIRGGFFVAGDNATNTQLRFDVIDPEGKEVLRRVRSESLFHFTSGKPGTYTFALANQHWAGEAYVTLIIGAGNETTLRQEDLTSLNQNLLVASRMVRDIHSESQYLWSRQKARMHTARKLGKRLVLLGVAEVVTIVAASVLQVYFMKGLVSNRKVPYIF